MNVALVLNYEVRKKLLMLEVNENDVRLETIKTLIKMLIEKFIETDKGKTLFEENGKVAKMYNFETWKNNIPEDIYEQVGVRLISATEADVVYEVKAFENIIKEKPVSAIFGVYDSDYCIAKYQIDKLLNSVNWSNDYIFRPLIFNGNCTGFGLVSDDLLIADEETDFSLNDFLTYAAKCAHSEYIDGIKIYENQNYSFSLIRMDI